jgi:hypothetical protein
MDSIKHVSRLMATICIMALTASVYGQQTAETTRGKMRPPQPLNLVRIPPADKAVVTATLQRLYDVVLRNPGLREPLAFDSAPSARADMPPSPGFAPVEYDVTALIYWYRDEPATKQVRLLPASMIAANVFGNGLEHFWRRAEKWQEDEHGPMYLEPRHSGDVQGYPVYEPGVAVITKNARPIFAPVSRERAVRFIAAKNRKDVDVLTQPAQANQVKRLRACIAKMEQELTALSPQERATPAYVATTRVAGRDAFCDPFSTSADPNARRIVAENPDFYDRRLPRTAIQVILMNLSMFNRNAADQRGQHNRIADGMDVPALAQLTMPR